MLLRNVQTENHFISGSGWELISSPLPQYAFMAWCLFKHRDDFTFTLTYLTTASRTALGPTHPPSQWVPGTLSLGIKRPGHEADHSPSSCAEVKDEWSYTSTPPILLYGVVLS
jgi:hypothetical protein